MPLPYFRQIARELPRGLTPLGPARTLAWPMRNNKRQSEDSQYQGNNQSRRALLTEPRVRSHPSTEPAAVKDTVRPSQSPRSQALIREHTPANARIAIEAAVVTRARDPQHRVDHKRPASSDAPKPVGTADTSPRLSDVGVPVRQAVKSDTSSRNVSQVIHARRMQSRPAGEVRDEIPAEASRVVDTRRVQDLPALEGRPDRGFAPHQPSSLVEPLVGRALGSLLRHQQKTSEYVAEDTRTTPQKAALREVHIGSIEVVVTPVPAPNGSRKPEARATVPLSQGYVSRWGLRQG